MPSTRLYELQPDAAVRRLELRLDGTRLSQRRLGVDDEWAESATVFSNHAEAREAFAQLCVAYDRKGRLISKEDDAGPPRLHVDQRGQGTVEVVSDWLLEEGPRLLGPTLFALYQAGGLPLGSEGRVLVSATLANVSVPSARRLSSRHVHHPHFLMDEVLRQPVAKTLKQLCFVERARQFDDEPGRSVEGELASAVRIAVRSKLGPGLERLEAGSFEQPGEGKPRFPELERCTTLRVLKVVFQRGFTWKGVEPARLERLELGFLSSPTQLAPIVDRAFPRLQTLSLGVTRASNLLPTLAELLTFDRFPTLRRLALRLEPPDSNQEDPTVGDEQGRLVLQRLVGSPAFDRLHALRLAMPLGPRELEVHRDRLLGLERLELPLDADQLETARLRLPHLKNLTSETWDEG